MVSRVVFVLAVVAATVTILIFDPGSSASDPRDGLGFQSIPCAVTAPAGQLASAMRCGWMTVPENRAITNGRTLRLAVAVLPAKGPYRTRPLVYLDGGPGAATLDGAMQDWTVTYARQLQTGRDIVFFDQRGTGRSTPSLACPEVEQTDTASTGDSRPRPTSTQAAIWACHDRLASNVDFASYTSAESAADVIDLMSAMGYSNYDLYGVSYGTRLALTVLRTDKARVHSVVLDSTVPPQVSVDLAVPADFQRSLDLLARDCKAEPSCASTYPDLMETFRTAMAVSGAPALPATGICR